MPPLKSQFHVAYPIDINISDVGRADPSRPKPSKFAIAFLYGSLCGLLAVSTIYGSRVCGRRLLAGNTVVAEPAFSWEKISPSPDLSWTSCNSGYDCARLEVPLDYADPTGEKAAVALMRVKSKVSHGSKGYRGPILLNPGGPGGSGTQLITMLGKVFQDFLGGEYDIIGFDPRGIAQTTPQVLSFVDDVEREYWDAKAPPVFNSSSDSLPRAYARSKLFGELGEARSRRAAEHVSTAVVARDMLAITKAHGRDKLLYWGFSYGTVLGATYAAMFPDNIERLIIDGVVDFDDYYSGKWETNLHDTDKILQYFWDGCAKAGPGCPLHANSSTLVQQRVNALLAAVQAHPLPVLDGKDYDIIDYTTLKTGLFFALYRPWQSLPAVMDALAAAEKGDGRPAFALWKSTKQLPKCNSPFPTPVLRREAQLAVMCGEAQIFNSSLTDIIHQFEELSKISIFSDVWMDTVRMGCAGWRVRVKERFAGPFTTNTSFPLLIIGNTADPVTPLRGAKKAAEGFKNSMLLTVNTPGHSSLAGTSLCTSKHIRQYFREGKLPEKGTVCEVQESLFGDTPDFFQGLNAEDKALLEVSRSLSQGFHAARDWVPL